jgi:hypothetical protein
MMTALKSGNLTLLDTSEHVQLCTGIDIFYHPQPNQLKTGRQNITWFFGLFWLLGKPYENISEDRITIKGINI